MGQAKYICVPPRLVTATGALPTGTKILMFPLLCNMYMYLWWTCHHVFDQRIHIYVYIHIFVSIFILEYMYKERYRYRYRYSTQKKEERLTVELKQFHLCRCSSHSRRPPWPTQPEAHRWNQHSKVPMVPRLWLWHWHAMNAGCHKFFGGCWWFQPNIRYVLSTTDSYRQLQPLVSENGATAQSVQCPFMDPYIMELQFQDPVCPHHVSFKNLDALSKSKSTKSLFESNTISLQHPSSSYPGFDHLPRVAASSAKQKCSEDWCFSLPIPEDIPPFWSDKSSSLGQYGKMKTGCTKQVELDDIGDIVVWIMRPRLLFPGP